MKYKFFTAALFLFSFISNDSLFPGPLKNLSGGWNRGIDINGALCDIYLPESYSKKNIILLPGWNFTRQSWIENTRLKEYSDKLGYALILPDMKKTLYESEYYPETRMKWNLVPGGEYIKTFFIPELKKRFGFFEKKQKNFLLGLSTGGRGVALISLENPGIFLGGAALSGDFSQENMPSDRIMTGVYGPYQKFKERWTGRDNPMSRSSEWNMHIYLSHGSEDKIVPPSQTELFYKKLSKENKNFIIEYRLAKGYAHDYTFWGGELENVFSFFEKL